MIVGDVVPRGPAEAAGLEIKDILLTLNGTTMENARQFGVNIYQRAGETVTIELLRGTEKLSKQVAVLERPSAAEPAGRSDAFSTGDVIYAVNDQKVPNLAELKAALQSVERGQSVAVQVERLGQLQFLVIEIQ